MQPLVKFGGGRDNVPLSV